MKTLPKCGIDVHVFLANEKESRRRKVLFEREKKKNYLSELLVDIANVFEVDLQEVLTGDSHGGPVMVRKIFYYISRKKGDYGYKAMAKAAGRTDHATCIYHIRKVEAYLKVKDPDFLALWDHYLANSKIYTKNDF
jgi:chromosomal replication initiation ATPase DnaA